MALLIPNAGETILLNNFFNKVAPQDQTLKLYTSNTTPAETDTAATYTEAAWTGYAAKSLTGASWTLSGTAPTQAATGVQTFTSSANQTLVNNYGYFVIQTTSGTIMFAERFTDAPYAISNNGDVINVTCQFTAE